MLAANRIIFCEKNTLILWTVSRAKIIVEIQTRFSCYEILIDLHYENGKE